MHPDGVSPIGDQDMPDMEFDTALHNGRPLVFGEVLFDCFPDGSRVLGGAPFNVAWHLQGLGLFPLFVSSIGKDAAGREVTARMIDWGMDVRGIQLDPVHLTGNVAITLNAGQPTFDILPDQAYDHIDTGMLTPLIGTGPYSLLYHGSLIARSETSRKTLHRLRGNLQLPIFVDINLRAPWWNMAEVVWALDGCRWLKLNDDELAILSQDRAERDATLAAQQLRTRYAIERLILTHGASGAQIVAADEHLDGAVPAIGSIVDTVGAGDAFSAVVILGITRKWPWSTTLARALHFAAAICTHRGATINDRRFYADFIYQWEE